MTPYVIGICGGSGSGKTSFVRRLREQFSESEVCIVSQDDYYLPKDMQQQDEQGRHNFDLPQSFDKKGFKKDIQALIGGQPVQKQEHVFNNPNVEPRILTFNPAPVIIIEGLFVLHFRKIQPFLHLKVFINAKENLKVIRRIVRDQIERGYPIEDVLYQYQYHVLPSFERYIQPYKDEADIVINNNQRFDRGLEVISGFIRDKLSSM